GAARARRGEGRPGRAGDGTERGQGAAAHLAVAQGGAAEGAGAGSRRGGRGGRGGRGETAAAADDAVARRHRRQAADSTERAGVSRWRVLANAATNKAVTDWSGFAFFWTAALF